MALSSNFGFIYFPGPRASAYLKVLVEQECLPSTIIKMANPQGEHQQSRAQDFAHLGPILADLNQVVATYNIELIETTCTSINDQYIADLLTRATEKEWLFSGGGILREHLFQGDKRYLHVHPGMLPEEKGSTCFYYTLLTRGKVAASAFWLTPQLDAGQPICSSEFTVNMAPEYCTDTMADYWLDPYIRAATLRKALQQKTSVQEDYADREAQAPRAYYVIHPILRIKALQKLKAQYRAALPTQIIEVDSE